MAANTQCSWCNKNGWNFRTINRIIEARSTYCAVNWINPFCCNSFAAATKANYNFHVTANFFFLIQTISTNIQSNILPFTLDISLHINANYGNCVVNISINWLSYWILRWKALPNCYNWTQFNFGCFFLKAPRTLVGMNWISKSPENVFM